METTPAPSPTLEIPKEPAYPWRLFQSDIISDNTRLVFCVKAAQIGVSTACAAWAVVQCLKKPNHLVVILSRSEAQAKELARKAKLLVDKLKGVEAQLGEGFFQQTLIQEHFLKFPNGSRIIALSSNPETARGYTGDVILDEFAFHPNSEEIFKAAYRQITLGYKMRIVSTPNGQQGKFYNMARQFGLADGMELPESKERRAQQVGLEYVPTMVAGWSIHWIDVHRAIADGFPVDAVELRRGCDEETWLQEYCCHFVSTESQWIPPQLFDANVDDAVTTAVVNCGNNPPVGYSGLYAGWDIARHKHLSVIWLNELIADISITRAVIELSGMSTPAQIREARALLTGRPSIVRRMVIDKGSMGLTIFETLQEEFGDGAVEGMDFTLPNKEAMAVQTKRRMEDKKVRIPDTDMVRNSFRMVKKQVTATGHARFDADEEEKYGHADHWWAQCMALAAESHPSYGLLDYLKNRNLPPAKAATASGTGIVEQPAPPPGETCKMCNWPVLSPLPGGGKRCVNCGAQTLPADRIEPVKGARLDQLNTVNSHRQRIGWRR